MALISHHGRTWDGWSGAREAFVAEADALLGQVGMGAQAERACGILAYGDLKRIELAVALANAPKLLLMDEPTAGMAPGERLELMELTARIAREQGIAVLFTEHDMDVVFAHADRILLLDRGRLIAEGSADEVRANPVQAVYLGAGATFGALSAHGGGPRHLLRARASAGVASRWRAAGWWCCSGAMAPASRRP
jgi:branched-chain amino acid transport system ATP-binding protein